MTKPPAMSRVPRSRVAAQQTYDRLSRWYDLLAEGSEGPFTAMGLDLLAAQPGERVLELGYGTGHGLVRLAQDVGAAGRVVGVDLSAGMAAVAAHAVHDAGHGSVILTVGDALHVPLGAGTMDAIFLSFTLELFDTPELPVVLAECHRVLAEGGRLGVVALAKAERDTLPVRLYEWAHRIAPRWIDCRPIPVTALLGRAGFDVRKAVSRSMWGLPVAMVLAT